MPYRLQTSGIGWLVAVLVLVGLTLAVFARGLRGPAVVVTVVDDAVVRWLAGLHGPGLEPLLQGLARISSWWVLYTLYFGLILALLVLRRWRHLIVWWVATNLAGILNGMLARIAPRPRPFGVDIQASWGGWALPSEPVFLLAAVLVGILYTLVPEGRWRNTGKWVATALIALVAVARIALGWRPPATCWSRWALGLPSRCWRFAASPQARCSRSPTAGAAPPTWTSAEPAAERSAARWRTSSAWLSRRSSRSGWPGRPAPPPADHRQGRPATAAVRQAVRPKPPAVGPLVQAGPGVVVRAAGG